MEWDVLSQAADIVQGQSLPGQFEAVAYERVLDRLLGQSAEMSGSKRLPRASQPDDALPATRLGRVSEKLGVDPELVNDVFYDDGELLGVGIASSRLDGSRAGGTKQLALLIAAARQAGGFDEEWTSVAEIRRICVEYGRYDSSNFGATIQEMGDLFQLRGNRGNRQVKVKRPGYERAGELIHELAGR